jgi:hypothetical protein
MEIFIIAFPLALPVALLLSLAQLLFTAEAQSSRRMRRGLSFETLNFEIPGLRFEISNLESCLPQRPLCELCACGGELIKHLNSTS